MNTIQYATRDTKTRRFTEVSGKKPQVSVLLSVSESLNMSEAHRLEVIARVVNPTFEY
jgi:hypothetical protein